MSAFDPDGFDRQVEEAVQKRAAAKRNARRPSREPMGEARPPAFSDDAMALRFAERHAGDLRFVALWNKWLIWTGTVRRFAAERSSSISSTKGVNGPRQRRLPSVKSSRNFNP